MASSLFGGGCGDGATPFEVQLEVADEYFATWTATRPPVYSYTLVRHCECVASMAGPVTVTVGGSTVLSKVYQSSGLAIPEELGEHFPTVDGLFGIIRNGLEAGYVVTVTYDDQTGVPLTLLVDPDPDGAEDEIRYSVLSVPVPAVMPG